MHAVLATRSGIQLILIATAIAILPSGNRVFAQYPTVLGREDALTFGRGLMTSPEVGPLEGVQRFGDSLRTDPDRGVGYTYRVFPPATRDAMDQETFLWAFAHFPEVFELKKKYQDLAGFLQERGQPFEKRASQQDDQQLELVIAETQLDIANLQFALRLALGGDESAGAFSRYAPGFNTTTDLRTPYSSTSRGSFELNGVASAIAGHDAGVGTLGFGVNQNLFNDVGSSIADSMNNALFHQPLIQIKVRIIEATRRNSSDFRSVLDYISRQGTASLVQGNNINNNKRSTRAASRLPNGTGVLNTPAAAAAMGLANLNDGAGALVNLTTEHLNFVTNMLVTEFSGDVVTVPEVTTLNGQNVEFVAGDARPLPLGLATVQGTGVVRQDVFYKHIGTLLSITPRIVNWGKHLEGAGEAPIVAQEINNWNRLAAWMSDDGNIVLDEDNLTIDALRRFADSDLPIPIETKTKMLAELEKYPAQVLRERFASFPAADNGERGVEKATNDHGDYELLPPPPGQPGEGQSASRELVQNQSTAPILRQPSGRACDWKPEDCTIDLEILVRESDLANNNKEIDNSIANIIQVKSGHGAVMGGMISVSEIQSTSKIPVLGDLPAIGYLFRSKSTDRAKTELIILVEATVLPNSALAREETARDFQLGQAYVSGGLRDNPLELGMQRAGFGQYLPPASVHEDEFWMEHGNTMRRVVTEIDDFLK